MGSLNGKVAVITGAGRGQGRSHAITLAKAGADVVVSDIDFQVESIPYGMNSPGDLEETKRLVEAEGVRCVAMKADVRDPRQVEDLMNGAAETFGGFDILIANAGGWSPSTVVEMTDAQWDDVITTNLTGTFHTVKYGAPHLIKRGAGRIIVTCSTLGRQGMPNMANYTATRWGQLGFVKSAAIELGPYEITVNAVCPTMVETEQVTNDVLYSMFRPDLDNATRADAEEVMRQFHHLPTAWVQPQDVSNAIRFLVSDEARFITGIGLDISAGKACEYAA